MAINGFSQAPEAVKMGKSIRLCLMRANFLSRLAVAIFLFFTPSQITGTAYSGAREDDAGAQTLLGLLKNNQVLARAVYKNRVPDDEVSESNVFMREIAEFQEYLLTINPAVVDKKNIFNETVGADSVFKDETWAREILNLQNPDVRYPDKKKRKFTALESTTILVNQGLTEIYVSDEGKFSVGLLYDADKVDNRKWIYVFNGDAASSTFNKTFAYPPIEPPKTFTGQAGEAWVGKSGFRDREAVIARLTGKPGGTPEKRLGAMNEILVGLNKEAIVGVFFYARVEDRAQALLEAVSRRQLLRREFGKAFPLVELPHIASSGEELMIRHVKLEEQWLALENQLLANKGKAAKTDWTPEQIFQIKSLQDQLTLEFADH